MVLAYAKLAYDPAYMNSSDPIQGFKIEKATQCSLALCQGDWKISVNQGTTVADTLSIDYGHLFWRNATSPRREEFDRKQLCWRPTSSPSSIPFDVIYVGEEEKEDWKIPTLSPIEPAFCDINRGVPLEDRPFVGSIRQTYDWDKGKMIANDYYTLEEDLSPQRIAATGLEHVMFNVANSLNKMVLHAAGEDVNGTAYGIEIFVVVQWPWLILPGLLVISGVLFFIFALLANKTTLLWKSSIFAFLYHGLSEIDASDGLTTSSMEKKAATASVQLQVSREGGDLKLERKESTTEAS